MSSTVTGSRAQSTVSALAAASDATVVPHEPPPSTALLPLARRSWTRRSVISWVERTLMRSLRPLRARRAEPSLAAARNGSAADALAGAGLEAGALDWAGATAIGAAAIGTTGLADGHSATA